MRHSSRSYSSRDLLSAPPSTLFFPRQISCPGIDTYMGIPKFYRYVAQRWPLASQQVNENVIPEFDNMYLDMNSIVHMSTHANAENVGHLDEDMAFQSIGNYIEHLFTIIKPKEVFFMAIDGVAPRAKMNQQRGRRFRSAKDAEDLRRKAAEKGLELDEDPFDSNCITPGTTFMAKLTMFLKYFVSRKISEDVMWQNCRIILSGHEVPGEGEHKIMNFIRGLRSQPGYNPNTRHCLYGLDADLIILGLSTHEPHFSLLREEVTFGRKIEYQSSDLTEQRFNLMHLSLVREYIELEISRGDFEEKPDFERQLDDLVLILFFVGNDFLPELPMLMINDGAIPVIFDTYREYLLHCGNKYLSLNGKIDFMALKNWMNYLKSYQVRKFEEQANIDAWFQSQIEATTAISGSENIVLSKEQSDIFDFVFKFMRRTIKHQDSDAHLEVEGDDKFLHLLAEQSGFKYENNVLSFIPEAVSAQEALRVLRIYSVAKVYDPEFKSQYNDKFNEWKNRYYVHKFGDTYTSDKIKQVSLRYLEGLQWVLFYYYRSCPSWSWFFDNHYAPMTTELISAIGDGFEPIFDVGEPFRPFEQLMSVLPDRSVNLLPPALHHLVMEPTSPIIDFYPHSFDLDQNGKKASWEAVVLIPFIDQDRLLKYVRPIEDNKLTEAEKHRNSRGQEMEYYYDPVQVTHYESPSSKMASIEHCTCASRPLRFAKGDIRYGRLSNSRSGVDSHAGFPSLATLPFSWSLEKNTGVKIFEMPSRDDSVVLKIKAANSRIRVGQKAYVNWPFLREAKITSIRSPDSTFVWTKLLPTTIADYKRLGVDIGETEAQIGYKELQGLSRTEDGSFTKDFQGPELFVPAQMLVESVANEDARFKERNVVPVTEEFPLESTVLLLLAKYYGCPATIKSHDKNTVNVEAIVPRYRDPAYSLGMNVARDEMRSSRWYSTSQVAKSVNLPDKFLMLLSSRLMADYDGKKVNLAIPLRKHGLGLMAYGYSRIGYARQWEFSERGVALIGAYVSRFQDALLSLAKGNHNIDSNVIKDMKDWIAQHTSDLKFIPVGDTHLDTKSIKLLENKIKELPPTHLERVLIKGVDRGALLSPENAQHQLRSQRFKLGDRVVSALDHGKVPLFFRGLVVGIRRGTSSNSALDILWDHEFGPASKLDNQISSNRGLTIPANTVLNMSNTQLEFQHGRQPEVTRISAKVDTKTNLAFSFLGSSSSKRAEATKFVPSSRRDDWGVLRDHVPAGEVHAGTSQQTSQKKPKPKPEGLPAVSDNLASMSIANQELSISAPNSEDQSSVQAQATKSHRRKGTRPSKAKASQLSSDFKSHKASKPSASQEKKREGDAVSNVSIQKVESFLPESRVIRKHDPEATKKLLSTLFNKSE